LTAANPDLVLTSYSSWHDHANNTNAPMIWLDGLDTPLVRMHEAGFYEEYHQERQDFGAAVNASQWRYPTSEMRVALQRLAPRYRRCRRDHTRIHQPGYRRTGDADDRCHMPLLRPARSRGARRRVCRTNHHVVEDSGAGHQRLD
jgi:gentisate 1,2-dioxygenase